MPYQEQNTDPQGAFDTYYQGVLSATKEQQADVVVLHFGQMSKERVNDIGFEVESRMRDLGASKGSIKRVFSIIVETLQNIRLHGEKDPKGVQSTYLIVKKDEKGYCVTTGNLIFEENVPSIESRIKYINQLDPEELKDYYMQVLTNGEISHKGGAGLGFITIAMKSKNNLNYRFKPLGDGLSMFELESFVSLN
ncbi:MAG: hypothetical protein COA57_09290 [Flavobacteriales bacterium]|nr:MAG: hypothetical protein COA57_09290 [Flavobacteriales bacterium]